MNNNQRAKKLLALRETDLTVLGEIKTMKLKISLRVAIIVIGLVFLQLKDDTMIFTFLIGLTMGLLLQDLLWIKSIASSWSFTKSVIDWSKVNQIAKK